MKYALVDDDLEFHNIFAKLTTNYIETSEIDYFMSSINFLKSLTRQRIPYNVIFLDIDMPDMDGITLSKKLYENNFTNVIIVFITNKANLVYKAFGLNVFSFIYKPDFEQEINSLFKNIRNFLNSQSYVSLPSINGVAKLQKTNISHCEIVNRKIFIIYDNTRTLQTTLTTLNDLYKLLDDKNFIFVNRSTIINIAHARIIREKLIVMKNGSSHEVSRHRQKSVNEAFVNYNTF